MSVRERIIKGEIRKFDKLRQKFGIANTRCFLLLKENLQVSDYQILIELTGGYYFYFSTYFNFFNLKYATLDDGFVNYSSVVSHIAFGEIIYELPPDNRVVIKPTGNKPIYQFLCKEPKTPETFTPHE